MTKFDETITFTVIPILLFTLLLTFISSSPQSGAASSKHVLNTFNNVKFISNYDGDTVRVHIPSVNPLIGQDIPVRVRGIDTPEMKGKDCEKQLAILSKEATYQLLKRCPNISLTQAGRGTFFRIVANVKCGTKDLGKTLIALGLAVPYDGKTKTHEWCK